VKTKAASTSHCGESACPSSKEMPANLRGEVHEADSSMLHVHRILRPSILVAFFLRILPNSASQPNQCGIRHFLISIFSITEKGSSLPAHLVPLLFPFVSFNLIKSGMQ
jgi:hypothetical protein